jgi:hypothetical protein
MLLGEEVMSCLEREKRERERGVLLLDARLQQPTGAALSCCRLKRQSCARTMCWFV